MKRRSTFQQFLLFMVGVGIGLLIVIGCFGTDAIPLPGRPSSLLQHFVPPEAYQEIRHGHKAAREVEIAEVPNYEDVIPVNPDAPFDAKVAYHNIINEEPHTPVVIFSKSYCPWSKLAKKVLTQDYTIVPSPRIVEIDLHPHGQELQAYLGEVTGRRTVPNVVIRGTSRGGGSEMRELAASGQLVDRIYEWSEHLAIAHRAEEELS